MGVTATSLTIQGDNRDFATEETHYQKPMKPLEVDEFRKVVNEGDAPFSTNILAAKDGESNTADNTAVSFLTDKLTPEMLASIVNP